MSSEESDISGKLKIPSPRQNTLGVKRLRRKRRVRPPNAYKIQTQSPVSKRKQRKIPTHYASVPSNTLRENRFQSPLFLPITKQGVPGVLPTRRQRNGQFENVSMHENQSSTLYSKSLKFHTSLKPLYYSSVASNDPTYHFYNIEGYNHNTFLNGNLVLCPPSRLALNQETSSSTHKLVSDFIRSSQFPINTKISPGSSTTSSRDRFYFQRSSSNSTTSTPNDYSALEERDTTRNTSQSISPSAFYPHPISRIIGRSHMKSCPISTKPYSIRKQPLAFEKIGMSPCSTLAEVGSLDLANTTISSSSTAEPCSLSESSRHSSEQMYDVGRSDSESLNSSIEGWDTEGSTSNISQSFMRLNSPHLPSKGNSTHLKPFSEGNGQHNTPQKNGIFSKTSISPIKSQSPSQLQTDALPLNTPTTPVRKSNEKVSRSTCQPSHSPVYHRPVASSTDFKPTNLFEENVRKYSTLDNNDSMLMSPDCPEEPLQQGVCEFDPSNERHSTANILANVRQSLTSLSKMHDAPTTDASEVAVTSNGIKSELSANKKNKTKKKSRLFSCFTSCFRLSSPQQDQT